ncbi:MAG: hypothetical protein U0Q47_12750 [Mycobacterium sp.]
MVQPGDLVFWFGGSEHHVAIVTAVQGSQITIAEAANPEAGNPHRPLGGSWDEAYLTGFGRVIRAWCRDNLRGTGSANGVVAGRGKTLLRLC